MASLGNLHFNIDFISDPKQIEEIKKKVLAQLEDLEVKFNMNIGFSKEELAKQVNEILSKEHKLNVSVDKESIEKSVKEATQKTSTTGIAQETQAVTDQAAAYSDLERTVNAIIGARGENIKRLVDEKNALANVQSQLRLLKKQQDSGVILNDKQLKQKAALINREFEHKQAISELNQLIRSDVKLSQSASTSMDELGQRLARLRVAYRSLSEDMRQSPFGRNLQQEISTVDQQIKAMDASIGNHQRNVGNYASGWNGLNHQVQQLVREMPSMAYGMNVFFSAISNNWPMLADEIKKANIEYKNLKATQAQGMNLDKQAVPVWKQLVKGIVSWQTALLVLTTVLITSWGKIRDWTVGLFSASNAMKLSREELKKLNEGFANTASGEIAKLDILFDRLNKAKEGTSEWNDARADIINQHGEYLSALGGEIASLNDKASAYRVLRDEIYETAKAEAISSVMSEYGTTATTKAVEGYAKIYDEAVNKRGEEYADDLIGRIRHDIEEIGLLSEDLSNEVKDVFTYRFGMGQGTDNRVVTIIDEILKAQNKLRSKTEQAENQFNWLTPKPEVVKQNKAYWQNQLNAAQKTFDSLDRNLKGTQQWEDALEEISKAKEMIAEWDVKEQKNTEKTNDPLRDRLNLLKEANSLYKEWITYVGRDNALSRAQEIMPDFNPDTFRQEVESIFKKGSKQTKIDAAKTLTSLDKESLDKALSETEKYISDTIKKWDLFSELFKQSGDYDFSLNAAFGGDIGFKSVLDQLKQNIEYELEKLGGIISFDDLIKMPNSQINSSFGSSMSSLVKAYQEQNKKITDESLKNAAKLISTYKNYEQQRKDIFSKGEKDIADLIANGASSEAIAEVNRKTTQSLASLDFEQFKDSGLWAKTFEDLDNLSTSTIDTIIQKLEEFKEAAGRDLPVNDFKELMNTLKKMRSEYESRNPFKTLISGVKEYKAALGELNQAQRNLDIINSGGKVASSYGVDSTTETETNKSGVSVERNVVKGISVEYKTLAQAQEDVANAGGKVKTSSNKIMSAFSKADPYLQSFASAFGSLSNMFEKMGNTQMADAMDMAQSALNSISNIGQGFAQGGIVGGIAATVGEAANWAAKAFEAASLHREALNKIMSEAIAQQRAYNLLLMEQNLEYEKASTIFGADDYGKAANAVLVMKKAISDLNETLAGTDEQREALYGGIIGSMMKIFGLTDKLKEAYAGLATIEIKTGHEKTGLFGWGSGRDVFSSVLDEYPELIDANGEFNASLAQTILETREMSDEHRASLQNLIDLSNMAEDALEEVRSYMSNIFGQFGQTVSNALVDAFRNGTNAAEAFSDSVTSMLENLAESMIYSVAIAPLIAQAEKDMMSIMENQNMGDEQKFNNYVKILDGLTDGILSQQGMYNSLLDSYKKTASEKGIDLWEPDAETNSGGLSAGIKGITEDTASLLASYANSIRADGFARNEMLRRLIEEQVPQMNTYALSQINELRAIKYNTDRNANSAEEIMDLLRSVASGTRTFHIK